MTARPRPLRALAVVAATAALAVTALTAPTVPAAAEGSSGGTSEVTGDCVTYATGTSMGSYCASGTGTAQTLRERFGKQEFDRCRFSDPPAGMTIPFNPTPDEGRWWVRSCINYIDFDTVTGGVRRQLNIHLAYLPNDYDTSYNPSPLSEFLWDSIENSTQFPVPFLQARPTPVPRVGVPTYMTFRWLNADQQVVADPNGPYAGQEAGGPFVQIQNPNGLLMRARATYMTIDPLQKDMPITDCPDVNPTYDEALGPDPAQQESECYVTFKRSSATARERMKETERGVPAALGDVYMLRIAVYWEVEYSRDGQTWDSVGRGSSGNRRDLIQITDQPLPVRESQASNLPPRFTLS